MNFDGQVVEASLWAICALVQDNPEIALVLAKSPSENRSAIGFHCLADTHVLQDLGFLIAQTISTLIWSFSKDRNTNVRLAASQW